MLSRHLEIDFLIQSTIAVKDFYQQAQRWWLAFEIPGRRERQETDAVSTVCGYVSAETHPLALLPGK